MAEGNKTQDTKMRTHHKGYWELKENTIEESKKYSSRTEFKNGSQCAYNAARKHNWLDSMPWLSLNKKTRQKGFWKDCRNVIEEGRKYKTKQEFKEKNLTAFLAAYRYGCIDEMPWLVKKKDHKWHYWTYPNIEREALKYNTKTDFYKGNQTAYRAALKLGVIDDFFIDNYIQY